MRSAVRLWFVVTLFASAAVAADAPIAIVSQLEGSAHVTAAPAPRTSLALFDWIPRGATIELAPASKAVIAFANGKRWELGERAKVTIDENGVTSSTGTVRQLASLPPMPAIAPVASNGTQRAAATRIRGSKIEQLYPNESAVTLADETTLRFAPDGGASRYRIEIENESGDTVFHAETESTSVAISPGILKPGARYYWKVRTLDKIGSTARGEAEFATLAADKAESRAALKKALLAGGDAPSLALLAEIDRNLGLLHEAETGLQAALAQSPNDAALRIALERVAAERRRE